MEGLELVVFGEKGNKRMMKSCWTESSNQLSSNVKSVETDPQSRVTGSRPPLLQLPVELLQLILRYTDSGAFFTCLITCRVCKFPYLGSGFLLIHTYL